MKEKEIVKNGLINLPIYMFKQIYNVFSLNSQDDSVEMIDTLMSLLFDDEFYGGNIDKINKVKKLGDKLKDIFIKNYLKVEKCEKKYKNNPYKAIQYLDKSKRIGEKLNKKLNKFILKGKIN